MLFLKFKPPERKIDSSTNISMTLLKNLDQYLQALAPQVQHLDQARKEKLLPLVGYIRARIEEKSPVALNFICTHNSRRSHLGQLWAKVAAHVHGVPDVSTFSGGTEATAFNPRAVAALERAGFSIFNPGGENPHYRLKYADDVPDAVCFSKRYDDEANPSKDFAAIMTCTDADESCPVIPGATRISLPYRDPKEADDTPQEAERYDERCRQLAIEMLYVFEQASGASAES